MKSLNYHELKSFATWLQNVMDGAQLQNIWTNGEVLVFEFYKHQSLWLCLDLMQNFPQSVFLEKTPPFKKVVKPLTIFLNAHAKNMRWIDCQVDVDKGRVLEIELTNREKSCFIQFIAIPRMVNVIAKSEGKSISWDKPKDLGMSTAIEQNLSEEIDWVLRGKEWLQEKTQKKSENSIAAKDPRHKVLAKKQSALQKMQEGLSQNSGELWKELGEILKSVTVKTNRDLDEKFHEIYNFKISQSVNRDHAFNKYKDVKRKRSGTEERIEILKKEISDLEKKISSETFKVGDDSAPSKGRKILEKSDSKGRKLALEDGFEAFIGKSAKDNLAILRQAQGWDLWLHLKDFPGAHAIITRPRNKEVPLKVIQKVSEWLIAESFSGKKIKMGLKYDVVVVETRFVRPIKGDKLGRVNYHNPQVFSFASKS